MDEVKRKAHEWAAEKGIQVLDPDGWNQAGRTWFEPITEAEFDQMAANSTIGPRKVKR